VKESPPAGRIKKKTEEWGQGKGAIDDFKSSSSSGKNHAEVPSRGQKRASISGCEIGVPSNWVEKICRKKRPI